jgi:hypothetical protein
LRTESGFTKFISRVGDRAVANAVGDSSFDHEYLKLRWQMQNYLQCSVIALYEEQAGQREVG